MTWPCHLVEKGDFEQPVGAMWFGAMPDGPGGSCLGDLSDEYYRDHFGKRPPIIVMLPSMGENGEIEAWPWCVDGKQSSPPHAGWAVTGEAPDITVSPSIHAKGVWHGWLTHGVISGEDWDMGRRQAGPQ